MLRELWLAPDNLDASNSPNQRSHTMKSKTKPTTVKQPPYTVRQVLKNLDVMRDELRRSGISPDPISRLGWVLLQIESMLDRGIAIDTKPTN